MRPYYWTSLLPLFCALIMVSCSPTPPVDPTPEEPEGFVEKEAVEVEFTNAIWSYIGDDMGEELSDAWMVKFYTDMEIDPMGNPIGPGCVVQLLLNVTFNPSQDAATSYLNGIYTAQTSTTDFNPGTFIDGYVYTLDLPDGKIEIPDGSFYADLSEGSTTMELDLAYDGAIQITGAGNHYVVEGLLVGDKCYKRRFIWSGKIEPQNYVEPEIPNSTIEGEVNLTDLSQMTIVDRGDSFFLRDESYRAFSVMIGSEGVEFPYGAPAGTGDMLRLDLLVPWSWSAADGLPEGSYPMVTRNENSSVNREDIVPFRAIPGLPDEFKAPYWSGCWYVEMASDKWSERYARIDEGTITVERTEEGGHRITATLKDSASNTITVEVEFDSFTTI